MRRVILLLVCLSVMIPLLVSCQISPGRINRDWTPAPTAPLETPTITTSTQASTPSEASKRTPTPSPTRVDAQSSCEQAGRENSIVSPNDLSYLLYYMQDGIVIRGRMLDMITKETHPLPDGLVPLGWSPSGKVLLLADANGSTLYTTDTFGGNPEEAFSVGSDQVEHWGWWLSEDKVIVADRIQSDGGAISWQYYLVNLESGSSESFDRDKTWHIYDVATNGGFWIEGGQEVDLVYLDHRRFPLWDEGDVVTEIAPRPSYLSIHPNNCGVVFVGCSGDRTQGDRSCSIYDALLGSEGIVSVTTLYPLGAGINIDSIQVSPNSRFLAFIEATKNLIVIELNSGDVFYESGLPFTARNIPEIIWGPNSNEIVIAIDSAEEGDLLIIQNMEEDTSSQIMTEAESTLVEWSSFSQ
jgi:uncharacterized SAM-binding protein YcdF (DUF218 family)